jgi:hypothetical protein
MRLSLVYSFSQRRSAGGATTTTPQAQQLGGSFEDNRLMLQLGIGL